jgi:hypothetical protein
MGLASSRLKKKRLIFFLALGLLLILNISVFFLENSKFIMILFHLNTLVSVLLLLQSKKQRNSVLYYFVFQAIGRLVIEVGFTVVFFFPHLLILMGVLLKLGVLPLV